MIWNRSASQLGNKALEDAIQKRLELEFPSDKYPIHIDASYSMVHATDYKPGGINETETIPEGVGLDKLTSVIETVRRIISKLQESGQLPMVGELLP